ncbi:ImmA/IrrE family metallo-endopeptidase [Desulfoscipio sp. XC116]|uniref:ImmA/IrrE family metallo-endopeptidase n=1 Tax=Desulfoscipio sp. XC116 TaxID=3144975 RepID=UPI00325A94DE
MKISLLYQPMGSFEGACKGFYLQQSRKQAIVINSNLAEQLQRIILIHELGHAILHRKLPGVKSFHDFKLFDETSLYEYEANIFAADFILEDQDVLRMLNDDISFFAAASTLGVPAELLDFKFRILKRKGYKVIDPPLNARANFLKHY